MWLRQTLSRLVLSVLVATILTAYLAARGTSPEALKHLYDGALSLCVSITSTLIAAFAILASLSWLREASTRRQFLQTAKSFRVVITYSLIIDAILLIGTSTLLFPRTWVAANIFVVTSGVLILLVFVEGLVAAVVAALRVGS